MNRNNTLEIKCRKNRRRDLGSVQCLYSNAPVLVEPRDVRFAWILYYFFPDMLNSRPSKQFVYLYPFLARTNVRVRCR